METFLIKFDKKIHGRIYEIETKLMTNKFSELQRRIAELRLDPKVLKVVYERVKS